MPIQLSTNTLKTRESLSDQWEASTIIVESDLDQVLAITGDGELDPGFTATDLTEAANELKNDVESAENTLNQLDTEKADEASLALRRSGATNTGAQIETGTYFYLDGTLKRAIATIAQNAPFTAQNCETVTDGGLNSLNTIENISNSITVSPTTGTVSSIEAYKKGNEIQVLICFNPDNVAVGTRCINVQTNLRPKAARTYATSTYSGTLYVGYINDSGSIFMESLIASASSSHNVYFSATFLGNLA